jgi:hypothetical protein
MQESNYAESVLIRHGAVARDERPARKKKAPTGLWISAKPAGYA